jgi:hypothetical protein
MVSHARRAAREHFVYDSERIAEQNKRRVANEKKLKSISAYVRVPVGKYATWIGKADTTTTAKKIFFGKVQQHGSTQENRRIWCRVLVKWTITQTAIGWVFEEPQNYYRQPSAHQVNQCATSTAEEIVKAATDITLEQFLDHKNSPIGGNQNIKSIGRSGGKTNNSVAKKERAEGERLAKIFHTLHGSTAKKIEKIASRMNEASKADVARALKRAGVPVRPRLIDHFEKLEMQDA